MKTRNRRKLTPFGLQIKLKLLEHGMTQRELCRTLNIPEEQLSEIMYGVRKAVTHRENIAKKLEIEV